MTLAQVKEFNRIYEVPTSDVPTTRVAADKLRYSLIAEEFRELLDAYEDFDLVEIADALGDIQYVVHGAIDVFGLEEAVDKLTSSSYFENRQPENLLNPNDQQFYLTCIKEYILSDEPVALARALANILSDLNAAAKMLKIDLDYIVSCIHKSNLTKLGEDGKVIRRPEDNKVMKGPNYQPPTGDIRAYLYDGVKDADLLG